MLSSFIKGNTVLISAIAIAVVLIIGAFVLTGCSGEKYKVDYCGQKSCYKNAKDSYKAGTKVELYFDLVATDTDYSFYLDGERINYEYDDRKGFIIKFVMPEHNVKLECESHNSMEYIQQNSYEEDII